MRGSASSSACSRSAWERTVPVRPPAVPAAQRQQSGLRQCNRPRLLPPPRPGNAVTRRSAGSANGRDRRGARVHRQPRLQDIRRGQGPDLHAPDGVCALSEPVGDRSDVHGLFRNRQDDRPARGFPAQQVFPAVLRLVPRSEIPLLPLRLVDEHGAGRPRAGGRRRKHQLRDEQLRDDRARHHVAAGRPQHRGPVPVLERRRRSADGGRVLPPVVHDRHLAQGSTSRPA